MTARLTRFSFVQEIIVCDYDKILTQAAKDIPQFAELNRYSLSDKKVKVVNQDAAEYLKHNEKKYDLIVCDFPDPFTEELGRLYSVDFYRLVQKRLNYKGMMCRQLRKEKRITAVNLNTIAEVFPNMLYFKLDLSPHYGFVLASDSEIERFRSLPDWTVFLNKEKIKSLIRNPEDYRRAHKGINTLENNILYRIAITDAYLDEASSVFPLAPEFRNVFIDARNPCYPYLLSDFIRSCGEEHSLILHVKSAERIRYRDVLKKSGYRKKQEYRRLNFCFSVAGTAMLQKRASSADHAEQLCADYNTGRPDSHPDAEILIADYLNNSVRPLLPAGTELNFPDCDFHQIIIIGEEEGIVLLLLIMTQPTLTVTLVHASSASEALEAAWAKSLLLLEKKFNALGKWLQIESFNDETTNVLSKLGAEDAGLYYIFTQD